MHLVDELVEVIFVSCAQVDEGLHCLVGICGNFLTLASLDCLDGIIDEHREICDAVVDIGRLVDAHKRLVEDGEKVAEQSQGRWLEKCQYRLLMCSTMNLPPQSSATSSAYRVASGIV